MVRALLGCLAVLLASAGASAVFVLEQVNTVVQDLGISKPLKVDSKVLASSSFGQPETLLLVGDDTRSVFKYYNRFVPNLANEMLLVRIDPSKPWISMMSIPRELWVPITEPDGQTYTNRLNSAYTYGTTTLLRTIKQITGLSVNHVIATTFTQFENAINTLGCVYDTIDERYYHNNADGGDQYQNVDLQPGYQCLNGSEAEQFVSYRHTDTSQVRDARDQSFLLAVKQQYGPRLAGNLGRFEKIFGETVQTDPGLRSNTEILNLANLLVSAAGLRVRQVHFQAEASPSVPAGDLTATPQQIQRSVHNFLHGSDAVPAPHVPAIAPKAGRRRVPAQLPLTPTLASNVAAEKATAANLPFTGEFPKVQDLGGSAFPLARRCTQVMQPCLRNYIIHAPDGAAYPIYVEVFSAAGLGQYYDVQGTTWDSAPLLEGSNETLRIGMRTYDLYYSGSHLQTVAWRQFGATYWVHNTLTNAVGNSELLAIAEQTTPVTNIRRTPKHLIAKAFSVPTRRLPVAVTPIVQKVGRIGGLVAMALLLPGLVVVWRSRRRLRGLRAQMQATAATKAALETRLASATAANAPRRGAEPTGAAVGQVDAASARPPVPAGSR
jgi:polyisoprenyl-teichoic acid--peptidoglycan teichoic acid transferase